MKSGGYATPLLATTALLRTRLANDDRLPGCARPLGIDYRSGIFPLNKNKILSQLDLDKPLEPPRPRTPLLTITPFRAFLDTPTNQIYTPRTKVQVEDMWDKVINNPVVNPLLSSPTLCRMQKLQKSGLTAIAENALALDECTHLRAANAAKKKRERLGAHILSKARVYSSEDLRVARELLEKRTNKTRVIKPTLSQRNTRRTKNATPTNTQDVVDLVQLATEEIVGATEERKEEGNQEDWGELQDWVQSLGDVEIGELVEELLSDDEMEPELP